MKKLLPLLLLLLSQFSFGYTYDFNENCRKAYTHILNLDFEKGNALIQKEKAAHPDNLITTYLENYIDFLTIVIGEDEKEFDKRKGNKSKRLDLLEKGPQSSPYYWFTQAEVQLQWAFSRIRFGEYLTAAKEINRAFKLLEENERKHPNFALNKKALGLLHALIGTIPDNYKWAVQVFGIDGSINQGVNELTYLLQQTQQKQELAHLQPEVFFFLTFIELNFAKDEDKIAKLYTMIDAKQNTNPLIVFSKASILLHLNKNDEAITALKDHTSQSKDFHFYYLDFLIGETKLHRLDKDAHLYFVDYLRNFKGNSYVKAAYQKLAWHYLLNGDTDAYHQNMKLAKERGNDMLDEDKQALKEAESKTLPNVRLLKARLLFDGGYYQKALEVLLDGSLSKELKTKDEEVELTYRLARIYHEWGKIDKALSYYELTISNGAALTSYYAANSALQMGLIYEQQGEKKKAEDYFKKSTTFKNKEYKNSIEQKAKAGLQRLKGK